MYNNERLLKNSMDARKQYFARTETTMLHVIIASLHKVDAIYKLDIVDLLLSRKPRAHTELNSVIPHGPTSPVPK